MSVKPRCNLQLLSATFSLAMLRKVDHVTVDRACGLEMQSEKAFVVPAYCSALSSLGRHVSFEVLAVRPGGCATGEGELYDVLEF